MMMEQNELNMHFTESVTVAKQQVVQSQEKFIVDLDNQEMIFGFTRNLQPKHGTVELAMNLDEAIKHCKEDILKWLKQEA